MKRARVLLTFLATVLIGAAPSLAQSGHARQSFQTRFGWFFLEGGGDLWNSNEEVFTLAPSDFDDFRFGVSYVGSLTNHFEVGLNLDFYEERARSAYRDFVDQGGFPILHDTIVETTPLTLDLRWLINGRYRQRGQGRNVVQPVFYIGAGAGVNFWEYEEIGDFLDFGFDPPLIVFGDFREDGEALTVHVLGGVELPVSPYFNVVLEARHSWSDDRLKGDFGGLGRIELGGTSAFVGAAFRF